MASRTAEKALIASSSQTPAKVRADILAVALTGNRRVVGAGLGKSQIRELEKIAEAVGAGSALGSTVRVPAPAGIAARSVVLVGLGSGFDSQEPAQRAESLRRASGSVLRAVDSEIAVALALPVSNDDDAQAIAEGAAMGAYRYTEYLSDPSTRQTAASITVLAPKALAQAIVAGDIVGRAVRRTRDLVNQPPLDLYPETFAKQVSAEAQGRKVKVTVYDEEYLRSNGFGGLIGVGQGSTRGPRLVRLEYSPRGADLHLALVGKGITFDSGGLSLKPAQSMEDMKSDMAGAAAAAEAVFGAADLGLRVKMTAWLCLAENMPGSSAQRPSDVITIFGGKTVEVTNTDAEGRLVLADGLVAAQQESPDLLIDIATLTGAQIVALGTRCSGVMGTEAARDKVVEASYSTGEQMWAMPFPEEIRAHFDSTVADLKNSGKRNGGMLAAGIFLGEFISADTQWAHIDIAGPSYNTESPWGYTPEAATGVPVRTLIEVAASMSR